MNSKVAKVVVNGPLKEGLGRVCDLPFGSVALAKRASGCKEYWVRRIDGGYSYMDPKASGAVHGRSGDLWAAEVLQLADITICPRKAV